MRTVLFTSLTYYTIVCFVPRDGKAGSSNRGCLSMPTDDEDCDSQIDKWYYNKEEKKCTNFLYGDCPVQGNIFNSEQECTDTCKNAGAGQHKGDPDTWPGKGHKGRHRPSRPSGSSEENEGRRPRRPGRKGSEGEPGGHWGDRRPPKFGGSTGGHNWPTHQNPSRKKKPVGGPRRRPPQGNKHTGSEENETGSSRESVKGHGGNQRPPRPSGPYRPKPHKPSRPIHQGPAGGEKHRPRPPHQRPGKGSCGARLRTGHCDDNSEKWFNDGDFFTCTRVPPGRCPTVGSFFESCEECMQKCRPRAEVTPKKRDQVRVEESASR